MFLTESLKVMKDKNELRKLMRSFGIPQEEISYVVTRHPELPDGSPLFYIANEDSGVMLVTSMNYENVPTIKFYIKKNKIFAEKEKKALCPGYLELKVDQSKSFFKARKDASKRVKTLMMNLSKSDATDSPKKAFKALNDLSNARFVCTNASHYSILHQYFTENLLLEGNSSERPLKMGNIMNIPSSYKISSNLLDILLNVKLNSKEADKVLEHKHFLNSTYLPDGKPGIFVTNGNIFLFLVGRQNLSKEVTVSMIFCFYEERVGKFLEKDALEADFMKYNKTFHNKLCSQFRNKAKEFAISAKNITKEAQFEDAIDSFYDKNPLLFV